MWETTPTNRQKKKKPRLSRLAIGQLLKALVGAHGELQLADFAAEAGLVPDLISLRQRNTTKKTTHHLGLAGASRHKGNQRS
jgi:hypothetical protein